MDSGGPGEFRGGMGATSCWIPYDTNERPLQLVLATFGQAFPTALGVDGGYPANTAMFKMLRDSDIDAWIERGEFPRDIAAMAGTLEYLPAKCETLQNPRDVFEHTWSGGGGFGDPIDRDPGKVAEDVANGAVSEGAARAIYGVVVNGSLDLEATERLRTDVRRERLS